MSKTSRIRNHSKILVEFTVSLSHMLPVFPRMKLTFEFLFGNVRHLNGILRKLSDNNALTEQKNSKYLENDC